jgi:1A family penicillin-binding protein
MYSKKQKKGGGGKAHHSIKHFLFISASLGFVVVGVFFIWMATITIPDFNALSNPERKITESTKIYDRTGEVLLYDIHENIKRTVVPFDEMSRFIKNTTVAIEDDRFYEHYGVRPIATLRAVLIQPLRGKGVQGGSTITQQVVKNSLLTNERKISRKLKEWILAIKLEQVLNKDEILALYLNEAPYGGNIYGIEEASRAFFGKSANDLDLAESAYIAALPKAPTYYSPYGNHIDKLEDRKNLVLKRMKELSYISDKEYIKALKEKVEFLPQDPYGIRAPHFVTWVKEYLVEKYGEKKVQEGGLKVITTLDYSLQQKAEEIVARFGKSNEEKFNAKNAGMVGIDPKTGQILVMVGSRNYFDKENEGNFNVTLGHRQPGSAFKPFVYATAFEKGYTPETVLFNLKTQFSTLCDSDGKPLYSEVDPKTCYTPKNYDHKYSGPITMRDALAQSVNVPAIKTLYLTGIKDSLDTAVKMGIKGLSDPNKYGLTLVLGGGEVSLLDLTSAYGVFANKGVRNPYVNILKIEDRDGKTLEEFTPKPRQVIQKMAALEISSILSDNKARSPAFGTRSPLYFEGRDVAVKTGTTNDYRDAWTIGYTPSFALGAWVGNNDNSSMEKKVAGFIVTPMWNTFMKEVLKKIPDEKFDKVPKETSFKLKPVLRGQWRGSMQYFLDSVSGKLATKYTPDELKQEKVLTQVHNILYWVNKKDPRGEVPVNPEKDPQFMLWEKPVQDWVKKQNIKEETEDNIIKEYDDVHTPELSPVVKILSPLQGQSFYKNEKITITTDKKSKYPVSRIDFFVNEVFIGSSKTYPFVFSFTPNQLSNIEEINKLKVVVYDSVLNKGESSVIFNITN